MAKIAVEIASEFHRLVNQAHLTIFLAPRKPILSKTQVSCDENAVV